MMSAPTNPSSQENDSADIIARRWLMFIGAMAVVGFHQGITDPVTPQRVHTQRAFHPAMALPVPSYRELSAEPGGPNATWRSNFAALKQERPGLFDAVLRTPAMKDEALADRARTRAFEGAPPVIPHAVEQQSAATCFVCHGTGLRVGDRIATKVSHAHYASCTQCHVEDRSGGPLGPAMEVVNEFVGTRRSGSGERAMPSAPPTIPHTTHLRDDCLSCHGLVARLGLRTTHPWLVNCLQCHVVSASLEQILRNHLEAPSWATVEQLASQRLESSHLPVEP